MPAHYTTQSIDVEIDYADLELDKLEAELTRRGHTVLRCDQPLEEYVQSGVSAYLSGRADALREWARNFLQDHAGRCLP